MHYETSSSDTIVPWYNQAIDSRVLSALVVLTRSSRRLGAHCSCERPPVAQIHESTYQYHPSLIPEGPRTCLIRPPKGSRVLCCCFQPRPGRVCLETAHLPDTRSTSTAQHSSTDPAHLYLPFPEFAAQFLMSLPCCRRTSIRPHL